MQMSDGALILCHHRALGHARHRQSYRAEAHGCVRAGAVRGRDRRRRDRQACRRQGGRQSLGRQLSFRFPRGVDHRGCAAGLSQAQRRAAVALAKGRRQARSRCPGPRRGDRGTHRPFGKMEPRSRIELSGAGPFHPDGAAKPRPAALSRHHRRGGAPSRFRSASETNRAMARRCRYRLAAALRARHPLAGHPQPAAHRGLTDHEIDLADPEIVIARMVEVIAPMFRKPAA